VRTGGPYLPQRISKVPGTVQFLRQHGGRRLIPIDRISLRYEEVWCRASTRFHFDFSHGVPRKQIGRQTQHSMHPLRCALQIDPRGPVDRDAGRNVVSMMFLIAASVVSVRCA
jgi:hypothetical protein